MYDPNADPEPRWTEERKNYLRKQWPTNMPSDEVLAVLNRMPGREISKNQMTSYAGSLDVARPSKNPEQWRAERAEILNRNRLLAIAARRQVEEDRKAANARRAAALNPPPAPTPVVRPPRPPKRTEPFTMEAMRGPDPRVEAMVRQSSEGRRGQVAERYIAPLTAGRME